MILDEILEDRPRLMHLFAAAHSLDITPPRPIALAGYQTLRKAVFQRVADPLEANLLALRDEEGGTILFVSLDLMYAGSVIQQQIREQLNGQIELQNIFLSASHTHSAPPSEPSLPVLGKIAPEYLEAIGERLADAAKVLLSGPFMAVSVEYIKGEACHSVNRRAKGTMVNWRYPFVHRGIQIRPNLQGPRDDRLHLIRLRSGAGKCVAVCWSYACHPVGFPELNAVSADFPGVVRSALREMVGDVPVVFWQGFSGNVRPRVPAGGGVHGQEAITFEKMDWQQWRLWSGGLARKVADLVQEGGTRVEGMIHGERRELLLSELGLVSGKRMVYQRIALGPELVICGLSAEVSVEYGAMMERIHAPSQVVPVGCIGDVFGYLPTSQMVHEGGYEAAGFVPRFGLGGGYSANVNEVVERVLRQP